MIRIAFAGFRHSHILCFYEDAMASDEIEICGAFEADAATRKEMEEKHGIVFNYDTYEELLADPAVDVVAIGDYYGIRGERAIRALEAHKHVFTDKPLCTSMEECVRIRELAEQNQRIVYLMLTLRFNPGVATAKKLISEGAVGEVRTVSFDGQHPLSYGMRPMWYFEEGKHGGTINDIAIHGVDGVRYMTGKRLETVSFAMTKNVFAKEEPAFHDSAVFVCEMTGGTTVTADVSYSAPNGIAFRLPTYWNFRVWGERGMLLFGCNLGKVRLYSANAEDVTEFDAVYEGPSLTEDFVSYIKSGRSGVISSCDAFDSTEDTLLIQAAADAKK